MKTQNMIKKTTALLVSVSLASQLAFAGTPSQVTPEKILLKNVIALSGEGISADQAQKQTVALISEYERTASQTGQLDRLEEATVELELYTPDQAQAFAENVRGSLKPVVETDYASAQDRNQALATALSQIAAPKGGGVLCLCRGSDCRRCGHRRRAVHRGYLRGRRRKSHVDDGGDLAPRWRNLCVCRLQRLIRNSFVN